MMLRMNVTKGVRESLTLLAEKRKFQATDRFLKPRSESNRKSGTVIN